MTSGILVSHRALAQDNQNAADPVSKSRPKIDQRQPRALPADPNSKPPNEVAPQRGEGGRPNAGPNKASESADQKKNQDNQIKVIRRESATDNNGDPEELRVALGDDGKVAFQFRDQGWTDLVAWLADIIGQPIDWQTLPGDSVNLVSPKRLNIDETIDLFNRHLLSRGFTMLQLDGGITIAEIESVDPGMVTRMSTDELDRVSDHTFARVMLDAGWLSAEKLAEELKAMLSPAGKLTPLATTNRLEAMDVVVNLRSIARLLDQERDAASREALAPEFRLRHISAEEAKKLLEEFLGVANEKAAPMGRELMQMMQRMAQQNGGKMPPQKKEPEISIVANVRQNSVLVRAPVDRVAIAAEFIKRIDVPGQTIASLSDPSSRVDVFRLVSLDPDKLISIVMDMNVLEPGTRIQTDKDNQAVIVSGSMADRFIVRSLIERLDGGKRRFEVLQLRRLGAAEVAESISFLMGDDADEDNNPPRRYFYIDSRNEEKKEKDKFRVAANVRYRQVLLWANENEMQEVRSLLIKLGELPPPGGSEERMRIIEASATPETLQYLRRIKQQWERMSSNELKLPSESDFNGMPLNEIEAYPATDSDDASQLDPLQDEPNERSSPATKSEMTQFDRPNLDSSAPNASPWTQIGEQSLVRTQVGDSDVPVTKRSAAPKPAIEISVDASGNLILRSDDTAALDRLEGLMSDFSPPRRAYEVFEVKHASVVLIAFDLQDYFQQDDDEDDDSDDVYRWIFGHSTQDDDEPSGLSRVGELKFLPNSDTGTLVVTGATRSQLRTIGDLIKLWDVPEPVNPRSSRFTKLVPVQYGRAEKIAETIKDAYRDLLSSNDRVFQSADPNRERSNRSVGSGFEEAGGDQNGGESDFAFNGKLSLGVDEVGNTLLVSAQGESLLDLIIAMIEKLDEAARPGGDIEVLPMTKGLSSEAIRRAIIAVGGGDVTNGRRQSTAGRSGVGQSQALPSKPQSARD
ncbi:MAG: secretin N-terminal domain-containing protein [Planctomycetota bacterium]